MRAVLCSIVFFLFSISSFVNGEDPYRFFTWKVTYGDIYPLGVKQTGILINGQFPGPKIDSVTNNNLIISVFNYLNEPFLISWNGLQQRRNSWQDGVAGTNCPIPPGRNFTYVLQVKDQIGSFFYFPSLGLQKAAGGFGGISIYSRPRIPVPFPSPAGDHTVMAGDWFKRSHRELQALLNRGHNLPTPDGLLINGRGWNGYTFNVDQGRTYRFRISNVGLTTSINFRIQGHKMKLIEVEGSHTLQNIYTSLDVHLGQSYSVLVTADQPVADYYVVISSRFTSPVITSTAVLHYRNSYRKVSGPPPGGPTTQIDWSLNQARSIRWNLTASGPRPNPQGSYHYGMIKPSRTIRLANSAPMINGKQRYAVNSVSYLAPSTPLKLADYFRIPGIFNPGSIPDNPSYGGGYLQTSVMHADFRSFMEIIFENWENTVQSWHIDGYSFFVVGYVLDTSEYPTPARNVGVQSFAYSARLCSWLTFIASIQTPTVTTSLLNIGKLDTSKYPTPAMNVGVQSFGYSARLCSWLTFVASIQAQIVTSSLLKIGKLNTSPYPTPAMNVGVQSFVYSARLSLWLRFIASIQAPIVTSSLLKIRKS